MIQGASTTSRRSVRRFSILAAALASLFAAAYFTRTFLLSLPAQILVRDDEPIKGADAIVILSGDIATRLPKAAALWRDGYAPRIVFCKVENYYLHALGITVNETDVTYDRLIKDYGVPGKDVDYVLGRPVTSTREEAQTLLKHFAATYPEAKRVIVVTTWSHSSRAGWIFDKTWAGMPKVEVVPSFATPDDARLWWRKEDAFLQVFNEYLKWIFYRINY
jgi:uncharacterized SAM-binding protein YcdF (DUF218 family)